MFSKLETDRIL